MTIVLDASVVLKWFVQEERTDDALWLIDHASDLLAPDLLILEVTNALWKKLRRGEIDRIDLDDTMRCLKHGVPVLVRTHDLIDEAVPIMLELDHPIYDCVYLALAEAADASLVTDDRRLRASVAGTRFDARVVSLGG